MLPVSAVTDCSVIFGESPLAVLTYGGDVFGVRTCRVNGVALNGRWVIAQDVGDDGGRGGFAEFMQCAESGGAGADEVGS